MSDLVGKELLLHDPLFTLQDGTQKHFASRMGDKIRCWKDGGFDGYIHIKHVSLIPIWQVDEITLKRLGVWDKLSKKLKQEVLDYIPPVTVTKKVRGRRKQYDPSLPRFLECTCGKKTSIGPALLLQKAEEVGMTWEEYALAYLCRKCNPKKYEGRGRKANPLYVGLPRRITCSICSKEIGIGPKILLDKSEEAGMSWEDYVGIYKCRSCKKADGTLKLGRGRKADPKYEGMPRTLECSCGKTTTIGPGLLLKKAEEAGVEWEEWVKAYRCRSCKKAAGTLRVGRARSESVSTTTTTTTGEPKTRKRKAAKNCKTPKKLYCKRCRSKKGTTNDQLAKQVAKSGLDEKAFRRAYICRSCRGRIRRGEIKP